jgi:hypothetical protein
MQNFWALASSVHCPSGSANDVMHELHTVLIIELENFPAGQLVHVVLEFLGEYVPASQFLQTELLFAPTSLDAFPASQA